MKKYVLSYIIFGCIAQTALALDLDLDIAAGYDSNPFKLSDSFSAKNSAFIESQVKLTQHLDQLRLRAGFKDRSYESKYNDANTSTWFTGIRYVEKHLLFGKKARSQIGIKYKQKDKTYVSRSSGEVGTFSGTTIEGRYDYSDWELKTKTKLKLSRSIDTTFKVRLNDRNYEDYAINGLSNFDYLQWSLANEWSYSFAKNDDVHAELSFTHRDFDDKRQNNLDGSVIAGTDLAYRTFGIELGYARALNERWVFEIDSSYQSREDNGAGYYDQTNKEIKMSFGYAPTESFETQLSLGRQDKKYKNSPAFDPANDGEPSKDGYYLKIKAEKALSKKIDNSAIFISLRYEEYDSSQESYKYDRLQSQVGVSTRF
jgi:hypothetical protein